MEFRLLVAIVMATSLTAAGCSSGSDDPSEIIDDPNLAAAEAFVTAFYSFDSGDLEANLSSAPVAAPAFLYYQGWAEGANYKVLNRMACEGVSGLVEVECSITVENDLLKALDLDFNPTDTFTLQVVDGEIVGGNFGGDDPELAGLAFEWVDTNRPELQDGVCADLFDGGPTPGECSQAFVQGFKDFAASDDFPTP